ncbi:MAG: 50S ribosomal protein L9 [Phycisphaerae bacterium]|jgi:large subunit ribosomal protein L9
MQVLLLKDVRKLGHLGDVVEVRSGYARNFLYPQRIATEPTEENLKAIEQARKAAAAERARKLKEYEALAKSLVDVSVTIEAAANPEGTLYGSVGAREIADALNTAGHPILAEQIVLDHPIRTLDNRAVKIEFTDGLTAEVKVWVVRAGSIGEAAPADGEGESQRDDDDDDRDADDE